MLNGIPKPMSQER